MPGWRSGLPQPPGCVWSMFARRRLRAPGHRAHAPTGVLAGAPAAARVLRRALAASLVWGLALAAGAAGRAPTLAVPLSTDQAL